MIIKFNKNIELSNWDYNGSIYDPIWYRKLIPYLDYDACILVSIRYIFYGPLPLQCHINFYSQLKVLHDYFPEKIEGDIEYVKKCVDDFLIKMSGLTAFL
jgi:hypothetical protein